MNAEKKLTEKLLSVKKSDDFVSEVLSLLDNNMERATLYEFIEENSDATPAEVLAFAKDIGKEAYKDLIIDFPNILDDIVEK